MTHAHITAWALGIILFFVAFAMYRNGNSKAKMVHMTVRLLYIIIIITGFLLYQSIMKTATSDMHMWYGIKMLVGIWVIGAMEMVLIRTNKRKDPKVGWIQFVIALLVVLYLGLRLPIGFTPFA